MLREKSENLPGSTALTRCRTLFTIGIFQGIACIARPWTSSASTSSNLFMKRGGVRHLSDSETYTASSSMDAPPDCERKECRAGSISLAPQNQTHFLTSLRRRFSVAKWYVTSSVFELVRGHPYSLAQLTVRVTLFFFAVSASARVAK